MVSSQFASKALLLSLMFLACPRVMGQVDGLYYEFEYKPKETNASIANDPLEPSPQLAIGVKHTLWIPSDVKKIRGIIVHQHGCGEGACKGGATAAYDLHWQALAEKWDCALLGPSYQQAAEQNCRLWCDPRNGSNRVFIEAIDNLAKQSGHPELRTAPWCLWGHSGGGYWSSLLQMEFPERIVAIWFQSGTAHSRWKSGEIAAPKIPDEAMKIPMMANPGLKEKEHERFKTAWYGCLQMFYDYRSRGAPIAFTPDPKSGHETRDSRYLAIPFFDACLEQRLPKNTEAGLRDVDISTGWLASVPEDPTIPVSEPVPYSAYTGDRLKAVWLPNESVAKAWHEFVQSGVVSDSSQPPQPTNLAAKRTGQSIELTWQAKADFESGIGGFELLYDEQLIASIPKDSKSRFGRPLFQRMSYHDTPEAPIPTMSFVDSNTSRHPSGYSLRTINSAGKKSKATYVIQPQPDAEEHLDLVYAETDEQPLELDLYLPKDADTASPLLVWIHGGGWRAGSRKPPRLKAILNDGIAVASISYRFTDKATYPAQVHDCNAAIRWLKAHATQYGYDKERFAVAGSSAGGYLALMVGIASEDKALQGSLGEHLGETTNVKAIVDFFGPSDFVLRGKTQPERAYTNKSGSLALLGGTPDQRPSAKLEHAASPTTYVTEGDPPLLIFHGTKDETVLLDQSERIRDLYLEKGLEVELVIEPEGRHGGRRFFTGDNFEKARHFLLKHLAE